jgi:glycosyltransferase involved in cell wall biosynthesis
MKVLQVHNFYQQPGGEETVMRTEGALLRANGHTVIEYFCSNDSIQHQGVLSKLKTGLQTIWSRYHFEKMSLLLKREKPDVCHVHNTFPLISPAVFHACHKAKIPVVFTVHNYRLLCANGLFLRNDMPCEECLTKNMFHGVKHQCYRDSSLATATIAAAMEAHHFVNTWNKKINVIVALTSFQKEKLIQKGISESKIVVKANTLNIEPKRDTKTGEGLLFIGRLDRVKGADLLPKIAERFPDLHINVLGQGPLYETLSTFKNIHCFGHLSAEEVLEKIAACKAVILPTRFYEGMPMTIIEAFACGKPVITTNHGAMPTMIDQAENGWLFEFDNLESLLTTVDLAMNKTADYSAIQKNCSNTFEEKYSPKIGYKNLMETYNLAIHGK